MEIKIKKQEKHIVIGGCSFTQSTGTWPYHIEQEKYGWVQNVGDTGAGNSYISRAVIYEVNEQLKLGKKPEEIVVLIMWSGITRKDFYLRLGKIQCTNFG